MGSDSIIAQLIDFVVEMLNSLSSGSIFFGSTIDVIRYAIDIFLVAALFYWILLFVKQSRAWQLIKGIVLILLFVLMCGLFGLEMIGFIFNRLLYVVAILFIVLFQPELRRVLETVGLKSFGSLRNLFTSEEANEAALSASFIHEIVSACKDMASTYTGALILIERKTRLDELLTQENVVRFDSTVTSSVLQSVFYKGSPMHDGGLLIREGRIIAARCHVPLSVTMHNLERSGTRHRAAVGASEMGDTVVVVVSEERGKVSIAVNGNLYEMKDSRELEANLDYLLGVSADKVEKKGIGRFFGKVIRKKAEEEARQAYVSATEAAGEASENLQIRTAKAEVMANSSRVGAGSKFILMLLSLLLSFCLWMYIQVNTNPVVTASVNVPITYDSTATPDNIDVSYPIDSVELEIVGRQETLDDLDVSDIVASIDYSNISSTGVAELPIVITSSNSDVYFRVERQVPETISVTVYSLNDSTNAEQEAN